MHNKLNINGRLNKCGNGLILWGKLNSWMI